MLVYIFGCVHILRQDQCFLKCHFVLIEYFHAQVKEIQRLQ